MQFRITFYGNKGTIYSYLDERKEDRLTIGEWTSPFPNTEEESTAFGLWESLGQSEYCPREFFEGEEVNRIKIEKGGDNK